MSEVSALLVYKDSVKNDLALQLGGRGARKLLVTKLFEEKERKASQVDWLPPTEGEKCAVQVMPNAEVAVFNQYAAQDRHFHKNATEIYMVLDGKMVIEVEGDNYFLSSGDMIVVNPNAVHEVKPKGTDFLCRVVTLDCGGSQDKYIAT